MMFFYWLLLSLHVLNSAHIQPRTLGVNTQSYCRTYRLLFMRIDGMALGEMRTRTVNSLEGLANYNRLPTALWH